MAALSVNTNYGALVALQQLNKTSMDLATTQNRINTGLKVAGAKDNGAVYSIAQSMRADHKSLDAAMNSVNMGKSVLEVTVSSLEAVSDLLVEMKQKAVAASDATLTVAQRTAYQNDYNELRTQITTIVNNASFNGINLLNDDAATNLMEILTNPDGTDANNMTVSGIDVVPGSAGGTMATLVAGAWTNATTGAADALASVAIVDGMVDAVNAQLATFGSRAKAVDILGTMLTKIQDALEAGIGNLVDADMAKESAKLQSLQVKQQLGVQALSIANQSPSIILSLFRG